MKKLILLIFCLVSFLVFPFPVTAVTPIIVRVGVYSNTPKIFIDKTGKIKGFWPDLIRYISAQENWQIKWVPGTWTQCLKRLEKGDINIMPDTGWTEPRSRKYAFSNQTVLVSWSRLYVPKGSKISSIIDLNGKTIAALRGSFNLEGPEGIREIIQKFNLDVTIRQMESYEEIFSGLQKKIIDGGVTNKDFGNLNENKYAVERTAIIFQPARMQFSFTKNAEITPVLIQSIDSLMKKLKADKNSIYYKALEKYIGEKQNQTLVKIIPSWAKITLLSCGGIILFLAAVGIVSRLQVQKRTSELQESKNNLSITLNSIGDAVISTDMAGSIIHMNPVAEKLTGWMLAQAKGNDIKKIFKIVNARTKEPVINPVKKVLEKGKIVGLANHTLLISKTGNKYQIADSAAPIQDNSGHITGVVMVFRDVTRDYRMQEDLQASEQYMRSIVSAAPIGIGVVINRIIKKVNKRLCEITGYSQEDLINQSARVFYPTDEDYEYVGQEKYRQIKAHGTGTVETIWQHRQGHIINVLLSSTPMDINNLSKGVTFTALDITEQKKTAEQLRQSQKMEAIGTLAGGIAHDFNNILSGIFGYIQLTEMNINDPDKIKKNMEQLFKGAQRASSLVQQILTFSRKTEFKKNPLKLSLIVKEALKFLRSSIPANIEIQDNISSQASILADPTQAHQVVINLCTNAWHAMRHSDKGILSIALEDIELKPGDYSDINSILQRHYIKLEIKDNGHGMDKKTMEKIFDPYFTTKKMDKGTGLGLAVVDGIIKEHSGFIRIDSKIGRGSTFQIFWPMIEKNHSIL